MGVPVLQNINWDPSAPLSMQTNSVHTDRHIYTALYAGKLTHTDVFIHSYTHGDTHTCCSQSWDRCDCSDNRNWATSGLTVRYVDVSRECSPSVPQMCLSLHPHRLKTLHQCVACVRDGAMLWSVFFQFSTWSKDCIPYTHLTAKVWHLNWVKRRDNFLVWWSAKGGGKENKTWCHNTTFHNAFTTHRMTESDKIYVWPSLRQLPFICNEDGNADGWEESVWLQW